MPPKTVLSAGTLADLGTAFDRAGELWDKGIAQTRPGEVACRAGCFGCCVGLFEISLPEALFVLEGFLALSQEERAEISVRAERLVRRSATLFPGDSHKGVLDSERSEEADDAYFDVVADTACPMLELPSGRCRIYEFRPITCRTYGLSWKREGRVLHPACLLNFTGLPHERQLVSGIDLENLDEGLDAVATFASEAGLALNLETTLAHVVTGSEFRRLRKPVETE